MSDAAVKVDPEFYNTRLLETGANMDPRRAGANLGGGGGGGGHGGNVGGLPDLPDYLVRQHSLLGFYLSLNPGDEGKVVRAYAQLTHRKNRKNAATANSSLSATPAVRSQ